MAKVLGPQPFFLVLVKRRPIHDKIQLGPVCVLRSVQLPDLTQHFVYLFEVINNLQVRRGNIFYVVGVSFENTLALPPFGKPLVLVEGLF